MQAEASPLDGGQELEVVGTRWRGDLVILALAGLGVYAVAVYYDLLEAIVRFTRAHESRELDELITVALVMVLGLTVFAFRRWHEAVRAQAALQQRNATLQRALAEIRQLRGILPICAHCKKIRDDQGYWHQLEAYIRDHSEADFSHGICPECLHKLYPDIEPAGD